MISSTQVLTLGLHVEGVAIGLQIDRLIRWLPAHHSHCPEEPKVRSDALDLDLLLGLFQSHALTAA